MENSMVSRRDRSIDVMKGLITVLMILSHSLYFAGVHSPALDSFTFYVNLTTFSGFMFCFGYVCNIAYLHKEKIPVKKLVFGSVKTFGVYYLSAFAYLFLVVQKVTPSGIADLLSQKWIAGYSEFLLSWAYLYLLMILGAPLLRWASKNKYVTIVLVAVTLAATFIDYGKLSVPWLGPVIGRRADCYFPLVQYFSYFLVGSYLSRNKIVWSLPVFLLALLGSAACYIYVFVKSAEPMRWGPSLLWVTGGYCFTYLYYLIAKSDKLPALLTNGLAGIGKQTLWVLLINNIICFAMVYFKVPALHGAYKAVLLALCLAASVLIAPVFSKGMDKAKARIAGAE